MGMDIENVYSQVEERKFRHAVSMARDRHKTSQYFTGEFKGFPDFRELFEEEVLEEAKGTLTLFVSPNGYENFLFLLEQCREQKIWYKWFYPTVEKEDPVFEEIIMENLTVLHVRS